MSADLAEGLLRCPTTAAVLTSLDCHLFSLIFVQLQYYLKW